MPRLPVRFLHSAAFDSVWLLSSPVWSAVLGVALMGWLSPVPMQLAGGPTTLQAVLLRTLIHAHLVAVFFRSHANPTVFARHRWRFVVVPLVLLVAATTSLPFLGALLIVTTYWDVYHSALQTFGLGRLYDQRAGADVGAGRVVDLLFHHAVYTVPFVLGPLWRGTAEVCRTAHDLGTPGALSLLASLSTWLLPLQAPLGSAGTAVGGLACVGFVAFYGLRWMRGAIVSPLKLILSLTTASVSIYFFSWADFNQALFVVNVFHAVQYLALLWWSERTRLVALTQSDQVSKRRWIQTSLALATFLVFTLAYGFWAGAAAPVWTSGGYGLRFIYALVNVVALLHFWYDGFIWSVRRGHV